MSTLANSELALTFLIACCAKATILLACALTTVIALRRRFVRLPMACSRSCAPRLGLSACEAHLRRGLDAHCLQTFPVPQTRSLRPPSPMRQFSRHAPHVGNFPSRHRAALRRYRLARRPPPHRPLPRTRAHRPQRLALANFRRTHPRHLLVPSPSLAGRRTAPPGKRTRVR